MFAVALDAPAEVVRNPQYAGQILRLLGERIPSNRRHRNQVAPVPDELQPAALSHSSLASAFNDDGRLQLATLGGGNHFVELQADEADQLWLMIHSGSRGLGQVVKSHHLARATIKSAGMLALDADTDAGQAYLNDQDWARRYAKANRAAMARDVIELLGDRLRSQPRAARNALWRGIAGAPQGRDARRCRGGWCDSRIDGDDELPRRRPGVS